MPPIRVLLADPQLLFADCLALSLSDEPGIKVISEHPTQAQEAIDTALRVRPDICLFDFWLGGMEGPAATAALLQQEPEAKVILLSWMHLPHDISVALASGAVGFLPKDISYHELIRAIRNAADGHSPVGPEWLGSVRNRKEDDSLSRWRQVQSLTRREVDLLRRLAAGLRPEEVAQEFGVQISTVRRHMHNILQKTDARSQMEAVALARLHGVLPS